MDAVANRNAGVPGEATALAPDRGNWSDFLDATLARCREHALSGLNTLFADLHSLRNAHCDDAQTWRAFCRAAREHELNELLTQDPFTRHAQTRPRGYPGDAALIDMIYEPGAGLRQLDDTGGRVYRFTSHVAECRAVRARRAIVAQYVDAVAARRRCARVLSLACGHLREADLCVAHAANSLGHWLAVDQDPLSLETVASRYGDAGVVEPREIPLKRWLTGSERIDARFDLAYASGLYEYLDADTAKAATRLMFDTLSPGGTLLVGNFLPDREPLINCTRARRRLCG